jgi:hypothetical protein
MPVQLQVAFHGRHRTRVSRLHTEGGRREASPAVPCHRRGQARRHAPGRPTPLVIIPGIGRFDAQCDDVDPAPGTQTTRTSINFTASVKDGVNVSRLLGRDIGAGQRPAVFTAPQAQPVSILASADGLFEVIMEAKGRSVLATGASRTDNAPGPNAACVICGTAFRVG